MRTVFAAALACTAIITRSDVDDAEYKALGARPEFASTVHIVSDSGGSGSGVLIAPTWVLTAAHVVLERPATMLHVKVGNHTYNVKRAVIHPDYFNGVGGLARTSGDHALLELDSPTTVSPIPLASAVPGVGTVVTIVGYGVGGPGAADPAGTRRGARNTIDQVGGQLRSTTLADHLLLADFDEPGFEMRNKLGSSVPLPLEGMASGGDSGGGVYVQANGQWQLAATFSVSSVEIGAAASRQFAGGLNVYVGVAPHRQWIDSIIHAAH